MLMGEFTVCYLLRDFLIRNPMGDKFTFLIPTTERKIAEKIKEDGTVEKISVPEFVQYRFMEMKNQPLMKTSAYVEVNNINSTSGDADSKPDNIKYVLDLVAAIFAFFEEKGINITDLEKAEIISLVSTVITRYSTEIDITLLALDYFLLGNIPISEPLSQSIELLIKGYNIKKHYDAILKSKIKNNS